MANLHLGQDVSICKTKSSNSAKDWTWWVIILAGLAIIVSAL